MTGRHRALPDNTSRRESFVRRRTVRRRSRLRRMVLLPFLTVAVIAGGAVAYSSVAGCGKTTELTVVASPDVEPAVAEVAAKVDKDSGGLLGGRLLGQCTKIHVTPVDSAEAAAALATGDVDRLGNPDIWIPDSSVWLSVVKASQDNADRLGASSSIASSPVVLAMVRPAAEQTGWPDKQLTWGELLASYGTSPVKVGIADPTRSASTMLTFGGIRAAIGDAPDAQVQMIGAVRVLAARVSGTTSEVLDKLPQTPEELTETSLGRVSALPFDEHGVWQYNQGDPAVPLAAIYPGDGTASLDYPFTVLARDGATPSQSDDIHDGAQKLLEELLGDTGRDALVTRGFRTAGGDGGSALDPVNGVLAAKPTALPPPDPQAIADMRKLWGTVSLNARILTVLDVSGSMGEKVAGTGGKNRMDVAKAAVQSALPLLREDTSVGLWIFSTELDGGKDYRELVPVGPLGGLYKSVPRRTALTAAIGRVEPSDGWTGLYDTTLAAYRAATAGYEPDKINVVVLLTDGRNQDPAGGVTLSALTRALGEEFDPQRPVGIISIGFGPDIDANALRRISETTHAKSYQTSDPALIQQILLEAIAERAAAS